MNVLRFDSDNRCKCDSGGAAPACHLTVLSQPSGQEGPAQVLQGLYDFLPHLIKSILYSSLRLLRNSESICMRMVCPKFLSRGCGQTLSSAHYML